MKILFKNLYSITKYDLRAEIRIAQDEAYNSSFILSDFKPATEQRNLLFRILQYFSYFPDAKFQIELENLVHSNELRIFPYLQLKCLYGIESGLDSHNNLPYVVHEKKRLYFPKSFSEQMALLTYRNYIEKENLLGGGYMQKAPHQYETESFKVEADEVVFDLGCAEGLFSLHLIERVKKIYLIETDALWIEPLKETFKPYIKKVEIINKLVSNEDTETEITIKSLLDKINYGKIFLKMDIEGYERLVLESMRPYIANLNFESIKMVCCTYHKHSDANEIKKILDELGFQSEYSDGFMLLFPHIDFQPPFFRKGLVRAELRYK